MSTLLPSVSARPLVTSGMPSAMPPLPVLVPMPGPSRVNHVSMVNVAVPKPGAAPNVTYSLVPSKSRAEPLEVDVGVGVAVGVGVGVGVPDVVVGKPGTQTGPFVAVPLMPLPDESATEVPEPSFMPQRPTKPGAEETSISLVASISACDRATFHT